MPALNEEASIDEAIKDVLKSFQDLGIKGELIIVNDGSSDSTGEIASNYAKQYSNVKLINNKKSMGVGQCYWDAVEVGKYEAFTWIPADGEGDAFEILRYIDLMDHVDIVIPYVYNVGVRTWKRRMLSKLYKFIINISFGILLNYMNGTVIFRRSVLKTLTLNSTGFFFQTELLIKAIKKRYLYAEVPVALNRRVKGKTKVFTLRSIKGVISGYLTVLFSIYNPKNKDDIIAQDSKTVKRGRPGK